MKQTIVCKPICSIFLILSFFFNLPLWAGPQRTTYQARIIKPNGEPLQANSVNFRFTILDPTGSCVLYVEDYAAVNMAGSSGLISFSLGAGIRTYPVSGSVLTFSSVFNNSTTSYSCQTPGIYTPTASDNRKIVMQFNDSNGWQTLPAMAINAVPYAMYADDTLKLNGKVDTDFVQSANIPSCTAGQALFFNGVSFSCVAVGGGGVTSSTITAALGYAPADGASFTSFVSNFNTVSSAVYSVSSTLTNLQNEIASLTTTVSSLGTSSPWTVNGSNIYYTSGNVGIGTSSSSARLSVGTVVGAPATSGTSDANSALRIGYYSNSWAGGQLEFGTYNSTPQNYASWIQARNPQDYSVNRNIILQPNGGNIGIGTSAPTARLHVTNNNGGILSQVDGNPAGLNQQVAFHTINKNITAPASSSLDLAIITAVHEYAVSYATATGGGPGMLALGENYVGIYGNAREAVFDASIGTSGLHVSNRSQGDTRFSTNLLERMRITRTTGNVGIGTSAPTSRLDVSGQTQIRNANTQLVLRDTDEVAGEFAYIERNVGALHLGTNNGTSSTVALTVKDGKVGVSTVSPTEKLHVVGKAVFESFQAPGINEVVKFVDSANVLADRGVKAGFYVANGTGSNRLGAEISAANEASLTSSYLTFNTETAGVVSEKVRITGAGNVGVGTSNPNSALEVSGTIHSTSGGFKFPDGSVQTTAANGSGAQWGTSGNDVYYNAGNVGIGISTPRGNLDVSSPSIAEMFLTSNGGANYTGSGLVIQTSTGASGGRAMGVFYHDAADQDEWFTGRPFSWGGNNDAYIISRKTGVASHDRSTSEESAALLTVRGNGYVGIGTGNPSTNFEVSGTVKITGGTPGTGKVLTSDANGLASWQSPTASTAFADGGNSFAQAADLGTNDNFNLNFRTNNSTKMTILASGSVGIGNSNPEALLDVYGTQNATAPVFRVRANGSNWASLDFGIDTNNNSWMQSLDYGSPSVKHSLNLNPAGGNVGIGTATPTATLQVAGQIYSSTGGFKFPDGSVQTTAVTGFAFSDGGNSFSQTADLGTNDNFDLNFRTNNSTKMTIAANGNVGIGTTSPQSKISLGNTANFTNRIALYENGANNVRGIGMVNPSVGGYGVGIWANKTPTDDNIDFFVKDGGQVSIGTNYPGMMNSTYYNWVSLHAKKSGSNYVAIDGDATGILLNDNTQTANNHIWSFENRSTKAQISTYDDAGNVTPRFTVDRSGNAVVTGQLKINGGSPGAGKVLTSDASGLASWQAASVSSQWATNGSNISYVSGSVGIGNTNPSYLLDVSGTIRSTGRIIAGGGTANAPGLVFDVPENGMDTGIFSPADNNLAFSTMGNERMRITTFGNVGLGTSNPTSNLHLVGAQSDGAFVFKIQNTTTSGEILQALNAAGAEVASIRKDPTDNGFLTINNSGGTRTVQLTSNTDSYLTGGNLGVGTASPLEKLHVVGNLRVQGSTDCTLGNGAGGTNCSSDARLKENIKQIPYALDKILTLQGVEFDWNNKSLSYGRHDIGVIAQDVEKVFPTAVMTDKNSGYKKVDYAVLVAPLIQAIKELYSKVTGYDEKMATQQRQIASLQEANVAKDKEIQALKIYLCSKDPEASICVAH